jgi:hypothetical protein
MSGQINHHSTVNEARKQLSDDPTVERVGFDGKHSQRLPIDPSQADEIVDRAHWLQQPHAFMWNGSTQRLIPVLDRAHPDYEQNCTEIAAEMRRWHEPKRRTR